MRRKKVWRYYCDHCKKGGCAAGHMAKHERGCTLNPDRRCGVCGANGCCPAPLPALINFVKLNATPGQSILGGDPDACGSWLAGSAVIELRTMADQCPVCMLAALRQSGTFAGSQDFDFKGELRSLWKEHDEERMNREYR